MGVSPDGEEGFPGTVEATVWYVAGMQDGKTVLEMEYEVELVGDECEETVVGVTNHRYSQRLLRLIRLFDAASACPISLLWLMSDAEQQLLQP